MVDLLQHRYSWTDEYVYGLDFERFARKVEIILKHKRQEQEADHKWKVVELLTTARSISFALQADKDIPLTKAEQNKGPKDADIKKTKRDIIKFMEGWQKALSHPWHFEEYNGFAHVFDKPQLEVANTAPRRLKSREDIQAMKDRLVSRLEHLRDTQGDVDLRELAG